MVVAPGRGELVVGQSRGNWVENELKAREETTRKVGTREEVYHSTHGTASGITDRWP